MFSVNIDSLMDMKRPGSCFLCTQMECNGGIMSSCSVLQKPELGSLLPFPCYTLTRQAFLDKRVFFLLLSFLSIHPSDGLLIVWAQRVIHFHIQFQMHCRVLEDEMEFKRTTGALCKLTPIAATTASTKHPLLPTPPLAPPKTNSLSWI